MPSDTSTDQLKLYSHQLRERNNVNIPKLSRLGRQAFFTLFVVSVDGVLGHEANYLLKRFADKLSKKWKKPYSQIMGWVQATISFQ